MKYDDALKAWGAKQLEHKLFSGHTLELDSINVQLEAEQSYGCSCSSDVSAHVSITGWTDGRQSVWYDREYFDFEDFLKEVCEAANGAVTLE
jgi:hypothetical protein